MVYYLLYTSNNHGHPAKRREEERGQFARASHTTSWKQWCSPKISARIERWPNKRTLHKNTKTQTTMASSSLESLHRDSPSSHNSNSSSSSSSSISSSNGSSDVDSIIHNDEIIALFGIHGATGSHFVKLALDAGYRVQALVPPTSLSKVTIQHDDLTLVEGTLDDGNVKSLARVVNGATYVVCLLGKDVLPSKRDYPPHYLLQFCKTLYPIMKESSHTKLFLYQVRTCILIIYYILLLLL